MTTDYYEPCFIDHDDPDVPLPAFISTTNCYELYGLRDGETLAEAIARSERNAEVKLP